jgi:hypothetical protein
MTPRRTWIGVVAIAACGRGSAPASSTAEPAPADAALPTLSDKVAPPDAKTMDDTPKIDWRIAVGRVGPIELGKPMPGVLLDAPDLDGHYVARFIADAQPLDGFRYDDPPLTVVLAAGPFAELDAKGHHGEPPVDRLRAKAAAAARGGVAVKSVMIHGPGPATADGLGVGSTLAEVKAVYTDVRLMPLPETLGDDVCIAYSKSNQGISFVFGNCNKANAGDPVKRVDVWIPDS